jgi:hypothetical protein
VPDGDSNTLIGAVAITPGSKLGLIAIQATSSVIEKPIPNTFKRTARPKSSDIGKKSSVLIYETRLKDNPLKSFTNYGIYPMLIYKMRSAFNLLK